MWCSSYSLSLTLILAYGLHLRQRAREKAFVRQMMREDEERGGIAAMGMSPGR